MNNNTSNQDEYLYQSWGSSTEILWSYPIIDYVSLLRMKLIKEFIGNVNGKRAIDIGCGNGSISLLLWLLGAKVSSIDTSIEALKVTRKIRSLGKDSVPVENLQKIINHKGLSERVQRFRTNLCQSDAMQLPYKEETFDFVCCLETLEFVRDDMPAIREIERITKLGGMILLFVPYDKRAASEAKSLGYYRRYSFQTIKEKLLTGNLDLKRFIFWYFPMLKLLDLIRLRYIFAAIGLWIEVFVDRNSLKSINLRNRDVFIHSLTRFYHTKFWRKAVMPLLLRLFDLNRLFQYYPYSSGRSRANDVFLILKKMHKSSSVKQDMTC